MKGLAFRRRLGFALQGISIALHRERSFRTQCLAGAAVLVVTSGDKRVDETKVTQLVGKVANGGPNKLAKGAKISKEYLDEFADHYKWFDIRVADDAVAADMEAVREALDQKRAQFNNAFEEKRKKQALAWMWSMIESGLHYRFRNHPSVHAALPGLSRDVAAGRVTPGAAAHTLLDFLGGSH